MIDVGKVIKGLEDLKHDAESLHWWDEAQRCADALELIKRLWRDMNYVRSCSVCRWRDEKHCSADADADSVAFKRWRDCYSTGNKVKWEWDSEWE